MKHPFIPADVPEKNHTTFIENYNAITHNTDRLFLYACDQKIDQAALDPAHLFSIAQQGTIGAMASQLALIARYAPEFKTINYIAKLNSKTNLLDKTDPNSAKLWNVEDVIRMNREINNAIRGIGITIYPGSKHEKSMMEFAAKMVQQAHEHGLVAILWMYPRGSSIKNERDPHLLAGVAGMAHALGADFVKIKAPDDVAKLKEITRAAGNTKVIISGGPQIEQKKLLEHIYAQLHTGNTAGVAIGRNIFQKNLSDAVNITHAISAIIYENKTVDEAYTLL